MPNLMLYLLKTFSICNAHEPYLIEDTKKDKKLSVQDVSRFYA